MSRYRPSQPKSSPYITAEGFRRLGAERDELWARRREVVVHLTAAAAEGDRSENAEYIYRKKQLRELDRRIRYLQKRLPELKVVEQRRDGVQKAYFGAWVRLADEDDTRVTYRIVGADELDPARCWITVDSPMARALLGRGPDDEVSVRTPEGTRNWWVLAVSYSGEDADE